MMDDGMLSQDEIDALLNVGANEEEEDSELDNQSNKLSTIEIDTLGEIGNISFGSSATSLSTLLNQKVEITTPTVSIIDKKDFDFTFEPVSVQVKYVEGFSGQNVFVIKAEDAAIISDIMLGGDGTSPAEELTDIHLSAVQEAMNQMMGAAATSMSSVFDKRIDISPPSIYTNNIDEESLFNQIEVEDAFVKVSFQLKVGTLIDSSMMQLIPIQFAKEMVDRLLNQPIEEATITAEAEPIPEPARFEYQQPVKQEEPQYIGNAVDKQKVAIQQAEFANFEQVNLSTTEKRNLDMLLDIPLKVSVELGRTKRTIKDILDLSAGSIIELDKLAGEPVDILVNNKLIAEGEVVVIDENFGVRVTDIISQTDRIMKLK